MKRKAPDGTYVIESVLVEKEAAYGLTGNIKSAQPAATLRQPGN